MKQLTDERICHIVDTHVGGPTPSYPLDGSDWINFARAIESEVLRINSDAKWIPVSERMPEPDSGEVLVWLTGGRCGFDEWHMYREDPTGMGGPTMEMGLMWRDYEFEEITHWMPLPAAPADPAWLTEKPNDRVYKSADEYFDALGISGAPRATGCPDTMDDTARFAADELPGILRKQAG